jgi:hypothetical protein
MEIGHWRQRATEWNHKVFTRIIEPKELNRKTKDGNSGKQRPQE